MEKNTSYFRLHKRILPFSSTSSCIWNFSFYFLFNFLCKKSREKFYVSGKKELNLHCSSIKFLFLSFFQCNFEGEMKMNKNRCKVWAENWIKINRTKIHLLWKEVKKNELKMTWYWTIMIWASLRQKLI